MTSGQVVPDLDTFRTLAADRRVVPVTRRLLADGETPVGVYRKLAGERTGTFLLESAEHGRVWSRYSFVGVRSVATLTERDGRAVWTGEPPVLDDALAIVDLADTARAGVQPADDPPAGVQPADDTTRAGVQPADDPPAGVQPADDLPAGVQPADAAADPLTELGRTVAALHGPRVPDLPPLTGGMVGFLGYDAVRRLERLPELAKDDLRLPELAFLLVSDLAVLDHADGSVLLVANAILPPGADDADVRAAYADARARLDAMTADLAQPAASSVATLDPAVPESYASGTDRPDFLAAVERIKEDIRAGEAFQVVLSQRFALPTTASALDVYRVLRVSNPSPYMYLLRFAGDPATGDEPFDVVGSSPEALVKVNDGRAMLHPIAGTRPRGATPEEDAELAEQLLADPKERAEHLMLVDLGRNDLGRVSAPGSVEVVDFMSVERYSHVMHIVSTVVGRLAPGRTAFDVLTACFPAGTLSGAPKPRAMEIIEELEPTRRGLYGGAVGYLDFAGDLDTAIAIRTALLRGGTAYVQAGAGIVADSDPEAEDRECRNKAAAVLAAVAAAESLRPAGKRTS